MNEKCNCCGRFIKTFEEWACECCKNVHHPECSGESGDGIGEYPDEDAYSICQKCIDKFNKIKPFGEEE